MFGVLQFGTGRDASSWNNSLSASVMALFCLNSIQVTRQSSIWYGIFHYAVSKNKKTAWCRLICHSNLFHHDDVSSGEDEKLQQKYTVVRIWPNQLQKIQFTCICLTNYQIIKMHKITNFSKWYANVNKPFNLDRTNLYNKMVNLFFILKNITFNPNTKFMQKIRVCETLCPWRQQSPKKLYVFCIFRTKVKVKVTRSLTLVSFEGHH